MLIDTNSPHLSLRSTALFCAALTVAFGTPAKAAPFAYLDTGAIIDTATNKVVGSLPAVPTGIDAIAVSPDGKFVYTATFGIQLGMGRVVAINTLTNKIVGNTRTGDFPDGVAVSPDGKRIYATNDFINGPCEMGCSADVFEISAATHRVINVGGADTWTQAVAVAPNGFVWLVPTFGDTFCPSNVVTVLNQDLSFVGSVTVGNCPSAAVISPDGKRAYVANVSDGTVSVIDTASLSVLATITIPNGCLCSIGIAITPDGSRAYVAGSSALWVIDTAKNVIVARVPAGGIGIAVAPDGKHVYTIAGDVVATATNKVVAKIPVAGFPSKIAIVPPPPGVPFLAFGAQAAIRFGGGTGHDAFDVDYQFTVSSAEAKKIDPATQPVTIQVGTFFITIPAGSFTKNPYGPLIFNFKGVIGGVSLVAQMRRANAFQWEAKVSGRNANLAGSKNPIQVSLIVGGDSGTTSVEAATLSASLP